MPTSVQTEDYSLVVKLLLAQYVYELGEHRFGDIAANLKKHPLLLRHAEPVPDTAEVSTSSTFDFCSNIIN